MAERPAPFPDEKVKYEKVHPSITVVVDGEGEMVTTDALTLAEVEDDSDVIVTD